MRHPRKGSRLACHGTAPQHEAWVCLYRSAPQTFSYPWPKHAEAVPRCYTACAGDSRAVGTSARRSGAAFSAHARSDPPRSKRVAVLSKRVAVRSGRSSCSPTKSCQVRDATDGAAGRDRISRRAAAPLRSACRRLPPLPPPPAAFHNRCHSKTLLPPASGPCPHLLCTVSLLPSPFPLGLSHSPFLASKLRWAASAVG